MIAQYGFYRTTKLTFRTERFAPHELSVDAFLGGALQIAQPVKGYRAGVDPVLLAASVCARAGQRVLELGCGGGVASLCLGARVAGLVQQGIEVQPAYAALAQQNARANGIALEVTCSDLTDLSEPLRSRQFDHIIANPPYFDRSRSIAAADLGRETGLGETTPLSAWIVVAAKRLAPKGQAHFVQRVDRLPEILSTLRARLGSIEVQPLSARAGRAPHLVLVRAKKDGRADFILHAPIVVHRGAAHGENAKDYNLLIEAVLRQGAALPFGGTA